MNQTYSAKEAHKELRDLVSEIRKLFNSIVGATINIEPIMLKLSSLTGSENAQIVSQARQITNKANELKILAADQIESLEILKKAPPGMVAGVVDFMHKVFVDPTSTTQRQEYMEKLRTLDKATSPKQYEELSNLATKRYFNLTLRFLQEILPSDAEILKNRFELEQLAMNIAKITTAASDNQQIERTLFKNINDQLQAERIATINDQNFWSKMLENFQKRFADQKDELARLTQAQKAIQSLFTTPEQSESKQTKTSQANKLSNYNLQPLGIFLVAADSWEQEVSNILSKLNEIIQKTTEKQTTEQSTILYRYFNFITRILDQHSETSISYKATSLANTIKDLLETVKHKTLQQDSKTNLENPKTQAKELD